MSEVKTKTGGKAKSQKGERKSIGNFKDRKSEPADICFADFKNPWTFYGLFSRDDETVVSWMRENGLLANHLKCPTCTGLCKLSRRKDKCDGHTFRCSKNRDHEFSVRRYSFFFKSKLDLRDTMVFIKSYLDGLTLYKCATNTGIDYNSTAVDWANMIREVFCEYAYKAQRRVLFTGTVELDESLFGRKCKYHRGADKGTKVWIFGMIERETNKMMLYPVENRSAETLIPLIERHCKPGSTIYSDSWAAYLSLNERGYKHFSCIHKTTFKQKYKNCETGEIVECHTNRMEGAWKHAKDHFRKICGTSRQNFESHLAEVIWRAGHKYQNLYQAYFEDVLTIFQLNRDNPYTYKKPLFDTYTVGEKDTIQQIMSQELVNEFEDIAPAAVEDRTPIVEDSGPVGEDSAPAADSSANHSKGKIQLELESNITVRKKRNVAQTPSDVITITSSQEDNDEEIVASTSANRKAVQLPKRHYAKKSKSDKLAYPFGFKPLKKVVRKKENKQMCNPYSKAAFIWSSSDEDFE